MSDPHEDPWSSGHDDFYGFDENDYDPHDLGWHSASMDEHEDPGYTGEGELVGSYADQPLRLFGPNTKIGKAVSSVNTALSMRRHDVDPLPGVHNVAAARRALGLPEDLKLHRSPEIDALSEHRANRYPITTMSTDGENLYTQTLDRRTDQADVQAHRRVGDEPGEPVGQLRWSARDAETDFVQVPKEHQGKGMAKRLYGVGQAWARSTPGLAEPGPSNYLTTQGEGLMLHAMKHGLLPK